MADSNGIHRFQLGSFACTVITDGRSVLTVPVSDWFHFVNADAAATEDAVNELVDAIGSIAREMSSNILLIDTGQQRVLVDTGNGPAGEEPGQLLASLAAAGVAPSAIDTVIITHGHFDHVGANADASGKPIFPNARYVITQTEWDHWTSDPDDGSRAQLLAVADRFERVAMDAELVPGIRAVPAPGHTPGQIALLIESDGQRLLHLADTLHHPVELLHPEWYFDFDVDPALTVQTRRALLGRAARERLLTLPYHFPFPGLGYIVPHGDAWTWERVP